jgi:hypothetical protein
VIRTVSRTLPLPNRPLVNCVCPSGLQTDECNPEFARVGPKSLAVPLGPFTRTRETPSRPRGGRSSRPSADAPRRPEGASASRFDEARRDRLEETHATLRGDPSVLETGLEGACISDRRRLSPDVLREVSPDASTRSYTALREGLADTIVSTRRGLAAALRGGLSGADAEGPGRGPGRPPR